MTNFSQRQYLDRIALHNHPVLEVNCMDMQESVLLSYYTS